QGVISPSTEEPEVAGGIAPAHGAPSGTRHVCWIRWRELLRVNTVLVGDARCAAAGEPSPLGGNRIVFPQVVQRPSRGAPRGRTDRILSESAEEKNLPGWISPQYGFFAASRNVARRCHAQG